MFFSPPNIRLILHALIFFITRGVGDVINGLSESTSGSRVLNRSQTVDSEPEVNFVVVC